MKRTKDYINLLPGDEGSTPRLMSTGVLILSLAALLWLAAYGWQVKIAWGLKKQLVSLAATKQGLLDKLQSMQKELGIPVSQGVFFLRSSVP